jgi:hypothetical protein
MYWVSFIRLGTGMRERQVATVSVVTPISVLRECSSPAQIGSSYVITGHCLIWCHVLGSGEYLSPDWCLFHSWKKAELREHIRRRLTRVGELCAYCQVSSRSKHHRRWRRSVMCDLEASDHENNTLLLLRLAELNFLSPVVTHTLSNLMFIKFYVLPTRGIQH